MSEGERAAASLPADDRAVRRQRLAPRFAVAGSIVLWVAVIVLGRYMPLFEDTLDPRYTLLQ